MSYVIVGRGMCRRAVLALARAVPDGYEVIVDRRAGDRRAGADRRAARGDGSLAERRRVVAQQGRRVADRRALTIAAPAPELPWRLRRHAGRLTFVTRLAVPGEYVDAVETARLALAGQGGDRAALLRLFEAHVDLVHAYASTSLRDPALAEAATMRTFEAMLAGIESFDPAGETFRAWLFRLALEEVAEADEPEPQDPVRGRRRSACTGTLSPLRWVSDGEVRLLVERLPAAQRHVVLLRHLAGLPPRVVADLLGISPEREEDLHATALAGLTRTLAGLGAALDSMQQREHMRRLPGVGRVLRERRLALKG